MADSDSNLDKLSVFWGTFIGFIVAAVVWLFRLPKPGKETRKDIIQAGKGFTPSDPVADSLAEGKRLAHEHKDLTQ